MMVRDLVDDAFSTVELLKQDEACEFVRKGHGRKGDEFFGGLAHRLAKAKRSANDDDRNYHVVAKVNNAVFLMDSNNINNEEK